MVITAGTSELTSILFSWLCMQGNEAFVEVKKKEYECLYGDLIDIQVQSDAFGVALICGVRS